MQEKAEEKAIARLSMAIRALLFIDEDSRHVASQDLFWKPVCLTLIGIWLFL